MIQIVVPYPPTLNHFYQRSGKRVFRSKEYRDFLGQVGWIWTTSVPGKWSPEGRFSVLLDVYPPDHRKRDLDNVVKPLFDALTLSRAWGDDSQVYAFSVKRRESDKDNPRVEVRIFRGVPKGVF